MSKKTFFLILSGVLVSPWAVSAQNIFRPTNPAYNLGSILTNIKNTAWIVFAAVAVVCFVIAGILFLSAAGDPKKLETAKSAFIWGVVGVVVGIVAYSIILIVTNILT